MKREDITNEEQLRRWVDGDSVHREPVYIGQGTSMELKGGECCPDFSCCKPTLLADADTRKAFAAANEEQRMAFLGSFMGAAIALHFKGLDEPPKVRIAGSEAPS